MTYEKINLSIIRTSLHNCRDAVDSADLQESISQDGVQVPVGINLVKGEYELIYGFRRYYAARALGLTHIPARVYQDLTQAEALTLNLQENVARKALTAMEEAQSIKRILDASNSPTSTESLSRSLGWSKTLITQRLALLEMPAEVQEALKRDSISVGQARAIASAPADALCDLIKTAEGGATLSTLRDQVDDAIDQELYRQIEDTDDAPTDHDISPVQDSDEVKRASDPRWLKDHLLRLGEFMFDGSALTLWSLTVDRLSAKRIPTTDLEALCDLTAQMVKLYEDHIAQEQNK